jgi:acetamidase/formamidase
MEHYLPSVPGNVHWGLWDGTLKPVLTIKSGDRVVIETLSAEPEDMPDASLGFSIIPGHKEVHQHTFRGPGPHFLTGPIFVEGAEPGHVLEVRLLDVKYRADWGWNLQVPFLGTLPEDFPELRRIHIPLDLARNVARMPWGQELALDPFFGNFGVAPPPSWGRLSSKEPRSFGGNMDNKELGVGSTTYFPVLVPGALFSAGDGHALQGAIRARNGRMFGSRWASMKTSTTR